MEKINLDPPEDYLEAQYLGALVARWLDSLDVAPITLSGYQSKISHFTAWWDAKGPSVEWRLTQTCLHEFEIFLREVITKRFKRVMSYQNRHAIMRAVRMMFRWSARTGRTVKNYGEWVPWPTGSTPQRRAATLAHLTSLMLAAGESRHPLRDQAILAFFIGTGCRRSEVASMRVEDLQMLADGSGTALVVGKHTKSNQGGQRAVGFDAATGLYLIRYMDDLVVLAGALWISDEGEPLNAAGIYQMVKRTIARANLTEHIRGCHDLRRAFATILGLMHPDSPGWADIIRRQLGHKHYSMTAHYTLLDVDDIRDTIVTPLALINRNVIK